MPKMSEYVKAFKFVFPYRYDKLLEKYKAIWTKIEDLKILKLNTLPVSDDRYIKNKIRTYVNKVYTNFHGLNVLEDDIESECYSHFS